MSLSYNGSGAYYRSSSAWEEDDWLTYQESDSIDLRSPLHIRILASDNSERVYTLRVNVHKTESDSLTWISESGHELLSGQYAMKATSLDNIVAVLVNNNEAITLVTRDINNDDTWNQYTTDLPLNTDVASLVKGNNTIYVNTTDGALYSSADGISWVMMCQEENLRLIGASNNNIYVIFDNAIQRTHKDNVQWVAELTDEDASFFPNKEIGSLTYMQNDNLTRMILVGNRDTETDSCAVVWSKCWTEFEKENNEGWMYYNRSWDNTRPLPQFTQFNIFHYNDKLMAACGKSQDGKINALERFFISEDNGLTWSRMQDILPPEELQGANGHIAAIVDNNHYIWIIAAGKVYRGRINKLGYAHP
jgi:hypothetical protein